MSSVPILLNRSTQPRIVQYNSTQLRIVQYIAEYKLKILHSFVMAGCDGGGRALRLEQARVPSAVARTDLGRSCLGNYKVGKLPLGNLAFGKVPTSL